MFAVQRPIIMCYRIAGIFRGYKCSRIEPVPRKFMNSRRVQYYGFEANGVEVQPHVDVRMHQKAGTQTTKIKSAKIYTLEIYPLYGIIVAYTFNAAPLLVSIYLYRITRMFCDHQTFAKFARFDQFATIKSAKPKLSLVNTHDPFQLERKGSTFLLIWLIRKGFHSQNILVIRYVYSGLTAFLLSSSGPHQQALIYGLTAYQPVASSLALANTRYNPVQASGYHLGQLPGTTTTSSLQHLAHIPAQSYYIGANTPCNAGQHQASFQSRQHLQGLAYGQVVAAGGSPQDYTSPLATTTTSALTSYNVGYGHLTTTSSYTQPAGNLSLMPPSVAPPHLLIPHQLPMTRTL